MAENNNRNIFTNLKKLFSNDVIIRNVGGDQLKVIDINQIQNSDTIMTNSLMDKFSKIHIGGYNSLVGSAQNYQAVRSSLYSDYESMDSDPIIASALDIIADESTLKNDMDEVIQIRSSDENIQKILYNLFYDVLNIEFNLWSWIRNMCKYGDFFLKLEIAEKFGIYNVIPYNAYSIIREENYDPKNPSSVRFRFDPSSVLSQGGQGHYGNGFNLNNPSSQEILFNNYEMAHFRLISDSNYLPYGRAYIEPARKVYKQLVLIEDAMLVHRIVRAPEKRVFFINVGSIPAHEVESFMQKTINTMKKTPYIDPQTGQYNLKFNIQNMMEDYYIPVRNNDSTTKIDTTKGLEYDGIKDVEYLRDKMLAALKVPKAFFGYEKDLTGKATLAAEDIRFARTVERIQKIILSELTKIALIHLYVQGFDNESLVNFELKLTTPSIIYDQEKIALLKEKVELAGNILDKKLLPTDWIYDNVFHFSEDQFDEYRDLIREDAKRTFRLNQIENEGNDPAESGESYGTPHDLAALYGRGRYKDNSNVPEEYKDEEAGRPEEKVSLYNTQDDNFGKDRLGIKGMNDKSKDEEDILMSKKNVSPLTLESTNLEYNRLKNSLNKIPKSIINKKKIIFEKKANKKSLLDEENLKF
jgi:hypothetical protein